MTTLHGMYYYSDPHAMMVRKMASMGLLVLVTLLCTPPFIGRLVAMAENGGKCCRMPDPHTLDCSGCRLKYIPIFVPEYSHITSLYLNDNLIQRVEDFAFNGMTNLKSLNIRDNPLGLVANNSFCGLGALEALDMTQTEVYTIATETFKPLLLLKNLKLGSTCYLTHELPKRSFLYLSSSLEFLELGVARPFSAFGEEFSQLQKLQTLVISAYHCTLHTINNGTFAVFAKSLQTLEVRNCEVAHLEHDSFKHFPNLQTLNLACNTVMHLDGVFDAIKQMPTSSLETLIVDDVGTRHGVKQLTKKWFNSSIFEHLRRLSLRYTHMVSVDIAFVFHVPSLEFLNMGYNSIFDWVYHGNASDVIAFIDKSNFTAIDISHFGEIVGAGNAFREKYCRSSGIYSDDFFRKPPPSIILPDPVPRNNHTLIVNDDINYMLEHNIPQSLLFAYASQIASPRKFKLHNVTFNSDNNVLFIDLSGTPAKGIYSAVTGLTKLQGLDVSGCRIEYIHPEFFDGLPALTFLNASDNNLDNIERDRIFKNTGSIQVLDLQSSKLHDLPESFLTGLTSLRIAYLNDNPLQSVVLDLSKNKMLSLLDMRNTSLGMSQMFVDQLDGLQETINHTLQLKLQGNTFQCDCTNLNFLKWLKSTHIDVVDRQILQCYYHSRNKIKRTFIIGFDVEKLEKDCKGSVQLLTILLTPIASLVLVVCVMGLVHNYRWSLRWRFYRLRRSIYYRRLRQNNDAVLLVDDNTTYDAFVSYNHDVDYQWIQDTLLPNVEEGWGLRLCVGQRDFLAGIPIAENICEAIDNSRYVILVITPAFVASEWCDFEMHMALVRGRRHLIMCYKEEVDPAKMSRSLRAVMASLNYIEYSEDPQGNTLFWQRLRDRLTSPIEM